MQMRAQIYANITFRLDPELRDLLDEEARRARVEGMRGDRSTLVRRLLIEGLRNRGVACNALHGSSTLLTRHRVRPTASKGAT